MLPLLVCLCLCANAVYAFGAGNIPSFAYMEGRAFRHGDIEDTLAELVKGGAGIAALASMIAGGRKFNGLDIKRVYFGCASPPSPSASLLTASPPQQLAIDIAALKKMPLQVRAFVLAVCGLTPRRTADNHEPPHGPRIHGASHRTARPAPPAPPLTRTQAHGYATHEFEVTPERIGVYLPVEHIDNPKGYGDGEDARRYHPALRPPVDVSPLPSLLTATATDCTTAPRARDRPAHGHEKLHRQRCVRAPAVPRVDPLLTPRRTGRVGHLQGARPPPP
ncbi:hypothetical protein C0993_009492 [Termitomyces sp. T159_Od127]|nr:hypothetical protein C0993_009492 [Termitomyces sp. T159_Od127]